MIISFCKKLWIYFTTRSNIALFENLSAELEATPAYLHVLYEYEMIEKSKEIISSTPDTEYTAFKATRFKKKLENIII